MLGFNFNPVGEYEIPLPSIDSGLLSKASVFCRDLEPKIDEDWNEPRIYEAVEQHLSRVSSYLSSRNNPLSDDEKQVLGELALCYFSPEGPLRYFLHDPELEEVCCNGLGPENPVFVFSRKEGNFLKTNLYFTSFEKLRTLINNLTALHAGRRMDLQNPFVMALVDLGGEKFRFTAVQERATSTSRIQFSIRKYAHKIYTPVDLIRLGTLNPRTAAFLWMVFQLGQRLNVLIVGRPASGKTTLLQALTLFIPSNQRIIDAEYQPELSFFQKNVAGLMSRPEEGLNMARLIDLCERYRPDRLIIGEVVSKNEMLSFLNASGRATGDGIYATYHANSALTALRTFRLNTKDKASALDLCNINLIVTVWPVRKLDEDGKEVFERKLMEIVEVGSELKRDLPELNTLFSSEADSWKEGDLVFNRLKNYFGSNEGFMKEWDLRTKILEHVKDRRLRAESFYEFVQKFTRSRSFRNKVLEQFS